MRFSELLAIVEDEPVFETSVLLSGNVDTVNLRRQLSRWTGSGRLYRLRRGLYALAPPYRKVRPHPFTVANRLVRPSYISLQAALSLYGLIPESVPSITSVTTARPGSFRTPLGTYVYRHVRVPLFRDYREIEAADDQRIVIATPEKALIDLLYLEKGSDSEQFLAELRLELEDRFDLDKLASLSSSIDSCKVQRAVARIIERARDDAGRLEVL